MTERVNPDMLALAREARGLTQGELAEAINVSQSKVSKYEVGLLEISAAMDAFEGYAHPHGSRIAVIADALAERFNFASHDRAALTQAALVHDIGAMVMNRDYIKTNRSLR